MCTPKSTARTGIDRLNSTIKMCQRGQALWRVLVATGVSRRGRWSECSRLGQALKRQLTSRAANYHNLNSSTEGGRLFNFMLADLSGALGDDKTILERLEAALAEPPRGETGSLPEIL